MNRSKIVIFVLLIMAGIFAAGCKDEVDTAITKLSGSEADRQQAMGTILSVPGAKEKLYKALNNTKKYDIKTRRNVAMLIGTQAESSSDAAAAVELEKALAVSEREVRIEILNALGKVPGDKALEVLQNSVDDKDASVGRVAWEILDMKVKEITAEADKLQNTDNAVPVKIQIIEKAVKINPCNPGLSAKLAGLYTELADQQTDDAASKDALKKAAATEKICGAFVRTMYLAWPFGPDFAKQYISTSKVRLDEDMNGADDMTINWEEYEIPGDKNLIDMRLVTEDVDVPREFSTYGTFNVKSTKAQDVFLRVGADVPTAIWVNGKKSAELKKDQVDIEAEKKAKASLKKGNNLVVFKITGSNRSKFKLRISSTENGEAKGVSF